MGMRATSATRWSLRVEAARRPSGSTLRALAVVKLDQVIPVTAIVPVDFPVPGSNVWIVLGVPAAGVTMP
jgi:hypothetical protein